MSYKQCSSISGTVSIHGIQKNIFTFYTDKTSGVKRKFKSGNMELINECRIMFGVKLPSDRPNQ